MPGIILSALHVSSDLITATFLQRSYYFYTLFIEGKLMPNRILGLTQAYRTGKW